MNSDRLAKMTGSGWAFATLCTVGALGFITGALWLAPPTGGSAEGVDALKTHPTVEFPPDPASLNREEAAEMRKILDDRRSDRQAAAPDPFLWASDPEKARRVQKRLDEEGELDKAAYEAIKALEKGPVRLQREAEERAEKSPGP